MSEANIPVVPVDKRGGQVRSVSPKMKRRRAQANHKRRDANHGAQQSIDCREVREDKQRRANSNIRL